MAVIARMQALLGGEVVTGRLRTETDLVALVRRGVPAVAVERLLNATHLGFPAIESHILPRRTYNRRLQANQPLDPAESDRLMRFVRLVALAEETFGSLDKALTWFGRANHTLGDQSPLSFADTDLGVREVETLLGRIGHGLAA